MTQEWGGAKEAPSLYPLDETVAYWKNEKAKEVIDKV
jgi:hypothetical protein